MRRSFLRLVVSSVVLCWALGFAVLVVFSRTLVWTEDSARNRGALVVYHALDTTPHAAREQRLGELESHLPIEFDLISLEEAEQRAGRRPRPSEVLMIRESHDRQWFYAAFADASGVLVAGPVNPSLPFEVFPIGVALLILSLPVVAGLVAVRVERGVRRVEQVSQAIAVGDLSARVGAADGPSSELAANFDAMAERVEHLIRKRDELVQAVSHELGSPLSRLRFHLELLEGASPAQREERLGAMTSELDALDALVAELLTYVQSDDHSLERQDFDPEPSLADLAELARLESVSEPTVSIELKLTSGGTLSADPKLFQRAIENLLRNAVRYAKGRVRLELSYDSTGAQVSVHDDGPGIPEHLRETVTAPFVRLGEDRGRKTGGVGLGLAIVSRILQRHGGQILISESPLGGALVHTQWPQGE